MNATDAVVSARSLWKTFGRGGVTALQDIDLDVGRGEFISLIGPSGCGKSTLLRVIGDLVEPTRGDILVNGKTAHLARLDRDYGIVSRPLSSTTGGRWRRTSAFRSSCSAGIARAVRIASARWSS